MDGFLTVGHPAAVAAVRAMLGGRVPHALVVTGPPSVGKRSLALDIAAALLCTGAEGAARPCRACRGCRLVEHGGHPDLHLLGPAGAGGQVVIGGPGSKARGVRDLVAELALLPVEGGARVAIVEEAHRANEDAQAALLKPLEEPLAGTTIVLLADDEELLLPTIRSRCARIRLGTVAVRDVERILAERGLADPPEAARLARRSGGRPGAALAYAAAPGAEAIRAELARTLLDLLGVGPARRLAAAKGLVARALELDALLDPSDPPAAGPPGRRQPGGERADAASVGARDRGGAVEAAASDGPGGEPGGVAGAAPADGAADGSGTADGAGADEPAGDGPRRAPAAARRRALLLLAGIWRELALDLALLQVGARGSVREIGLLEELEAAAAALAPGAAAAAIERIARAEELVAGNVAPELALDVLLVRWPGRGRAA